MIWARRDSTMFYLIYKTVYKNKITPNTFTAFTAKSDSF